MKIGVILGNRPEIIKMVPVIGECKKRALPILSSILISITLNRWIASSLKN
jgi:UDP-N-acetylglucosamine 2-epimerase